MGYNTDFLIAAMIIQLIILCHFSAQKRPDDLNNQLFLILSVLVSLDIAFEVLSTFYINFEHAGTRLGAMFTTTVFYLFQALLPFVLICYVRSLRANKILSPGEMLASSIPTLILVCIIFGNLKTGLLFSFDSSMSYIRGPWYMLMYFSALSHLLTALILTCLWWKILGTSKVLVLIEILILLASGIIVQAFCHRLLMTGFGLSLGILALFITINNPHANTDNLTSLYDKTYLLRKFSEILSNRRIFHVITVNLYQINHINKVTSVNGGDRLILSAARQLHRLCGDNVFRISGKRFLIFTFSQEQFELYLDELKNLFHPDTALSETVVYSPVIISGISHAERFEDGGSILDYAQYLESLAPNTGLNETVRDTDKTMERFLYLKKVEQFLHTAITNDLFEVYYQPVYSLKEKRYITLEALSRLYHPELGWIPPDIFIQIAEKNHLVDRITNLQFRRICRFIQEHPLLTDRLYNIKMNLSPLDLIQTNSSSRLIRLMDEYGVKHSFIQFEITETVATEYNSALNKAVDDFADSGIGLCLDDFGSGYANLNTVMQLPFSAIKLDRSLLNKICEDPRSANFYHSIVSSFQNMGFHVISEGVETADEVKLLSDYGVDMIQGFYFSKPLPSEKLLDLLEKSYSPKERHHICHYCLH